jgi:hypothetical protein
MLTLVYSKGFQSEAEAVADAFVKKSKGKRTVHPVALVSEEQLRDWNIIVSRLHASLAEVLSVAETRKMPAPLVYVWILQSSPAVAEEFLQTLLYLKTVSLQHPNLVAVGYRSLPSELSKFLGMVCLNAGLIDSDSTFQLEGLMDVIAAISDALLRAEYEKAEKNLPILNG